MEALLIFVSILFIAFIAFVIGITFWVFSISKQIELMTEIRNELKKLNSNEREVEK